MKTLNTLLLLLFISVGILVGCTPAPKADKATATDAQQAPAVSAEAATLNLDLAASKLAWIGTKLKGQHHGTFNIKEGTLKVKDNTIAGGSFVIDINSIKVLDMDAENNGKLEGHLKAADFFDAAKFPTATFEITGVAPYTEPTDTTQKSKLAGATHVVTGNLTLKEATKSISFPAKVSISDAGVQTQANFNIDRTQWGMVYGNDKGLGDKFIRPEVNIALDITAKK